MDYSGKIIRKTPVTPSQTSASGVWSLDEALQAQRTNTWPIANVPNPISRSLRFRSSASAFLNRTPASAGNRKTWTLSMWVKRGDLSSPAIFQQYTDGNNQSQIGINSSNSFRFYDLTGGSFAADVIWSPVYRDPSAWYHFVFQVDTTQATNTNRIRFYVNGTQVTSTTSATWPTQNADLRFNNNIAHFFAQNGASNQFFDGYMTEVNFIDGQALTPSSFGGTNAVTGVWEPRPYTGTYGTNGFLLTFSDITSTTTLGNDTSGNGNNWTTNNISLTAGSTYDSMLDVPTQWIGYNTGDVVSVTRGNYCVMNPVANFTGTLSNGNLTLVTTVPGNDRFCQATFKLPRTGKWYWENTISISTSADARNRQYVGNAEPNGTSLGSINAYFNCHSNVIISTATVNSNLNAAVNTGGGGTVAFAYDADAGSLWMIKDSSINTGSTANVTGLSNAAGDLAYMITEGSGTVSATNNLNFGQRPFAYTPPAGFVALCTTNLPNPTILQGNQFMNAVLYTGNGSVGRTVTGVGFAPDLVWIKDRTTAYSHILSNKLGPNGNYLNSNNTNFESVVTNVITSLDSDGFTVGSDVTTNTNSDAYVAWNWRANGSGVTNTAGTITSTVSANQTSGFSVVTYTGTGANATVGHGLGVAPRMVIVKNRSAISPENTNWRVYHASTGNTGGLFLNTTAAFGANSTFWNNTTPTSSVFTIGTDIGVNNSGTTYVAYCFAAVAGYSAFGSYTGNGSTDGPFVFTGFRPRYVMMKRTDSTGDWQIFDTSRSPTNVASNALYANGSFAEDSNVTNRSVDFLSNGFKIRSSGTFINASGGTFIYMAFAENPFKNALAR